MPLDRTDLIVWLDLETTGLDPQKDCIIEIGAVVTDQQLDECLTGFRVAEGGPETVPLGGAFTSLVRPSPEGFGRMMLNPEVRAMHTRNGLIPALLNCTPDPPDLVARHFMSWMRDNHCQEGATYLAGSGVGRFDRGFLHRFMPQVDRWFRYRTIDTSSIRTAHDMFVGAPLFEPPAEDDLPHRALDDAKRALDEARSFRDHWRRS